MNLTRFETTDGVELVIDTQTGEAFATQRGYARMSGRDQSTISRRCAKLDESNGFRNSEIDTGYGVKLVVLIPADLVYEWLFDDNQRWLRLWAKQVQRFICTSWQGSMCHQLRQYLPTRNLNRQN